MSCLLRFDNVCAGYGRLQVLNRLSFEVPTCCICGVIGPNGCGKTTMINALSGLIRIKSGNIVFDGQKIDRLSPDKRCHLGISRTFQIPKLFMSLSVFENVLGASMFACRLSESEARSQSWNALEICGIYDMRHLTAGRLTLLDRKRLELARAIAARPRLLLLDEVAAGLNRMEINEITTLIKRLKENGYTIIWIEHIIEALTDAADSIMCMNEGQMIVSGAPEEVLGSGMVHDLYIGGSARNG